jgi:hypothetical protein
LEGDLFRTTVIAVHRLPPFRRLDGKTFVKGAALTYLEIKSLSPLGEPHPDIRPFPALTLDSQDEIP